jgi:hypothetical protein
MTYPRIGCHTFRAIGITEYLRNGGKLEIAQQMANHGSARTTGLYRACSNGRVLYANLGNAVRSCRTARVTVVPASLTGVAITLPVSFKPVRSIVRELFMHLDAPVPWSAACFAFETGRKCLRVKFAVWEEVSEQGRSLEPDRLPGSERPPRNGSLGAGYSGGDRQRFDLPDSDRAYGDVVLG